MKFRPFSFAIVTLAFMAGATAVSAKGITPKVPALSDGCYQITDAAELYGFAEIVNGNDSTDADPSVCGELTKDIVVNDSVLSKWAWPGSDGADFLVVWEPIKEFSGTFDGNGHVISGLYSETGSGLFKSFVSSSEHTVVVKDLGIIDSYFLTKSVAGVLVESVTGDGEAQITNFYSLSELEATRNQPSHVPSVGGVVGYVGENTSLTLTNCYSAGELVDNKYEFYSQLIGYPYSPKESIKINNCYVLEKGSSGNGVLVDSAAFRNGAVAYLLRENSSGAIWGQDYLTYSGSVRIYVNLIFAGTYVSVRSYFSNVENGLMTRFFFTEMARDLGKNVEIRWDGVTKDERRAAEIVQKLYEQGSTTSIPDPENVISFSLPKAKKDAYEFNEDKIADWEASGPDEEHRDTAIDLLRRRAAVTIFRAAQVMYALEGNRETAIGREMAKWYGNESYLNQYIMFGDAINDSAKANDAIQRKQDLAASRVARNCALVKLYEALPDEFTREDFKKLLEERGMEPTGYGTYITRMQRRELIMPTPSGFKKILE